MGTSAVDIDRPPDQVFAYVTDPTRFAEWQDGVIAGRMATNGPPRIGDRCYMTRRIGFTKRVVTSTVTHVNPPTTWGVRGIDGPIRAEVDVTIAGLDGGRRSRVSIDVSFEGHGIGKIIVPLVVRPQAAREMPANLNRLKHRLDGAATV